MTKYTDEQLSRILSYSAVGLLGNPWEPSACIEQAADSMSDGVCIEEWHWNHERANAWDKVMEKWHRPTSPVAVLRWLESRGMA